MNVNVISYAVFGDDPKYVQGVKQNIQLAAKLYPDWLVYLATDNPELRKLDSDQVAVELLGRNGHPYPLFWRLRAVDMKVAGFATSRVIFRDADSRLTPREAAAVQAWMASDKPLHVMRDHPDHQNFPMLGGMWGVVCDKLRGITTAIKEDWWRHPKPCDSQILSSIVWPMFGPENALQHRGEIEDKFGAEPFPDHEPTDMHVGQIVEH